ncbi:MAG: hypothetical protein Q7S40_28715 [Opitutaceae bacterium]|nr:hypothetical protein [Opitutaceae bacterium]
MPAKTIVPPVPPRELAALATKPDYETCIGRIEAWFQQAVLDRPPVRFYKHNAQFETGEPLDRNRWPSLEARWFDTDYQLDSFESSIAGKTFHAETFPLFMPNLGPSAYSAFYAGRLEFAETTSWFEPVISDLEDHSILRGDPFASVYFQKLQEMTRAALARCGDRYWVGYTDLHAGLDCVAAWIGTEALFTAMAVEPEKLAPLLELAGRDFHRIFDWFEAMLLPARQPSITWIDIPCRGRFHVPSSDMSTMVSTEYFKRFALPGIRTEMVGMERAVFHVDGKGVARHLDVILDQPDIQAIQWVQGLGPDWPIVQWIPLLKRILAAGKSVLVDVPFEELDEFIARVPREGVFLCLGVPEGEEKHFLRRVERW